MDNKVNKKKSFIFFLIMLILNQLDFPIASCVFSGGSIEYLRSCFTERYKLGDNVKTPWQNFFPKGASIIDN